MVFSTFISIFELMNEVMEYNENSASIKVVLITEISL